MSLSYRPVRLPLIWHLVLVVCHEVESLKFTVQNLPAKQHFCLSVIAEAQRKGGNAVFVDVEHALDPRYAKIVGVDLDNLMVSQPESGEDALNITETLIRSGAIDVIVVDSVAALVSRQELDGQMGDTTVGLQARMMAWAMRRLTAAISKTNCVCIFTNQIREKIGVMFGSPGQSQERA